MVLSQEDLQKPLSVLNGTLPRTDSPKIEQLWERWKADIPSLEREDWEDSLEQCPKLVILSRDRLIQIKLLHRVYHTPIRLHKIYPDRNPCCTRCLVQLGTLLHMLWECPKIQPFWREVFDLINVKLDLPIPMSPELALLGIPDDNQRSHHSKPLISYLLFYAKKVIICKWSSPDPPTLSSWLAMIDGALPIYKLTYISRGCPWKFNKVWQRWTSTWEDDSSSDSGLDTVWAWSLPPPPPYWASSLLVPSLMQTFTRSPQIYPFLVLMNCMSRYVFELHCL